MYLNGTPILYQKDFMLVKKAEGNRTGLDLNKYFDFQPITKTSTFAF